METARPVRFRFGPFEADLSSQELFENGEQVHIQGKPFAFLAMLLTNHGQVVTRESMSHALWPNVFVQVDQGLNAAARKVRIAIKDTFTKPTYIETLGSRGYRFVHPVEVVRWSTEEPSEAGPAIRLAVLPLETIGTVEESLAAGVTSELIAQLGRAHPRLTVTSATSSADLLRNGKTIHDIHRMLNVEYVLTGSLRHEGDKVRVSAELIKSTEQTCIWAETYERSRHDVFAIQDEIAAHIVRSLSSRLLPAGTAAPMTLKTSFEVYENYLRGRFFWSRQTPDALRKSVESYRAAINADPNYALAHAGLADTFNTIAAHGLMIPREAYIEAKKHAECAAALHPEFPETLVARAWTALLLDRDWNTSGRLFERALQLNPSYSYAYLGYSMLLLGDDRADEAVQALERARQLDPLSLTINALLSGTYYFARRYDDAMRQGRHTVELDASFPVGRASLGLAFLSQRRHTDAIDQFELAVENSQGAAVMLAHLAYAYAEAGKLPNAESILHKIEKTNSGAPMPSYHLGLVRLALGDAGQALDLLQRALQEHSYWTLFMRIDPRLDVLRGSRRFEQLCQRLSTPGTL